MSRINWTEAFEDQAVALMDRVKNLAGAYITVASISTLTYKVYLCEDRDAVISASGEIVGTETTLTPIATYVFDALVTTAPWTADATGYNVRLDLPAAKRPTGGWHRVELKFTPTTGDPFFVVWGIRTEAIAGS